MDMQTLRIFIDRVVIYAGIVVVLFAMVWPDSPSIAAAFIVVGLLIIQLGVWNVYNNLMSSARKYPELRSTVDIFLDIVRELRKITEIDPLSGGIGDMRTGMIDALKMDLRTQTEVVIEAAEKRRHIT